MQRLTGAQPERLRRIVDMRDRAVLPRIERIADARAPSKHSHRNGCCNANSAELVPPCEPLTTIAPRSFASSA
jgi:hypothetical protein